MSLDIRFTQRKNIVCPKCGEIVTTIDVQCESSGGSVWYPFLESIGYYVLYEQRTADNDWYGKDMVLTEDQVVDAYRFVKTHDMYGMSRILTMLSMAIVEKDIVVVNADW